jgi:lipoteichoic acid synthase
VFRSAEKSRLPWAAIAALLALALSAMRAVYLERIAGDYTACHGCFLLPALGHDAWLLSALFAVLGCAALARRGWTRLLLDTIAATLILACALDLALMRLFNQRLYFADLLRFGGDVAAAWSVARAQLFSANAIAYAVLSTVVVVAVIGLIFRARRSLWQARVLLAMSAGAALFAAAMLAAPLRYVHDQYAWNVVEANLPEGRTHLFSPAFADRQVQQSKTLPATCETGTRSGRDVIIVITESLSAYQSALLGGPRDWLPRLDKLARDNHFFTNFHANGFTTDSGEIAVLTGRAALIPPGESWYSLKAFGPGADTLPGIAHSAGYSTHYFTTADLSFLDSGTWLRGLGFDSVEGSESPFYAALPRGQFGAADDAALFARFEQWLQRRDDARPFVAVLLTVSSHPPFVDPRTGKMDPAGSFGYVDEQIAGFHDQLDKAGFFASGILAITGDHRSMTPILGDEYKQFGERAFSRIPLIVAGAVDMPKIVDAPFQQSDFPASLAHIMGVEYCRSAFTGVFLDPAPAPAQYVVQARGDDRNRVDVYFDGHVASYIEDGDASRWTGSETPVNGADVAAWINAQRIRNSQKASDATTDQSSAR